MSDQVLWFEDKGGLGWFMVDTTVGGEGMRWNPGVYTTVEEAVDRIKMKEFVAGGSFKPATADAAKGEVLAYEGQVVKGSRMVLRALGAVDHARMAAFEEKVARLRKEGRIT